MVSKLPSLNCKIWHHQLKGDKPFRVVLKGIHASVPKAQIEKAFADLGYKALHIYCPSKGDWHNEQICDSDDVANINYKTRKNIFFVNLDQAPKMSEVLKVTQLGRHRVTIERARRRNEMPQCLRCHIFGNSKNYYLQDPICDKCPGPHPTTSCTSYSYLCINCGDDHASTEKVCPFRIEKLKNKLKPSPGLSIFLASGNSVSSKKGYTYSQGFIPGDAIRSTISYADIARPKAPELESYVTQHQQGDVHSPEDLGLGKKFQSLENAIRDINSRMDKMFKLVEENVESNKAFREQVQVLISWTSK